MGEGLDMQIGTCISFMELPLKNATTQWLKAIEIYSHSSGGYGSEIKMSAGLLPSGGLRENPTQPLFSALAIAGNS